MQGFFSFFLFEGGGRAATRFYLLQNAHEMRGLIFFFSLCFDFICVVTTRFLLPHDARHMRGAVPRVKGAHFWACLAWKKEKEKRKKEKRKQIEKEIN